MSKSYKDIPTNLVVGFLGVGKTTAIRHLLGQVPAGERWAVLVNEFGEVGIDGALLEADGIAVREVAGGCLCCVAAGGLQPALNRLIRENDPDRILIEPTGLGHPAQVLRTLSSPPNSSVLDLRASIGLVDARHLADPRYTGHPTWQDQVFLADVLVATKADLYVEKDRQRFSDFAATLEPAKQHLATVERGRLATAWLDLPRQSERRALFPEAHRFLSVEHSNAHGHDAPSPAQGDDWLRIENVTGEFVSCGWRLPPSRLFRHDDLMLLLRGLKVDRVKGVLRTEAGWMAYNRSADEESVETLAERADSRLEIISERPPDWDSIDARLRALAQNCEVGSRK